MFKFLDIFFVFFHTAVIFFNLLGWIWKKTRRANLVLLLLTGSSWSLLGIFYGWGYCPFTDWHFNVLEKMGRTDLPVSYIQYLGERITGVDLNPLLVDSITLYVFLVCLLISLFINIRDYRHKKHKN